jgi:hypothetical protein
MSLLLDPRICPDCRAALDAVGTCTGCGLRLTGPLATDLWRTMQTADRLVESLRNAGTGPVAAPVLPKAPPVPELHPRARRLPAGSVPVILFAVGGLCLLVAAVVFVAVAWSSFGIGTRTTILIAVTAGVGALATRLTLSGLRVAAETFWFLTAALVTIDLTAAYSAGLLGYDRLDEQHAPAVAGTALLALGLGVSTWARRTAIGELIVPALTTGTGALVVAAAEAWGVSSPALPTTVSVLALAGLTGLIVALRLPRTGYAVGAVTVLGWIVLLIEGVARAAASTPASWFTELGGWPVLAAAGLATLAAVVRVLPETARILAAAGAEGCLVLFAFGPGADLDTELLVAAVAVLTLAAAAVLLPRIWALPATGFTAIGLLGAGGYLLLRPLGVILDLPSTAPAESANLGLRLPAVGSGPSAWTAIVVAVVVVSAGLALAHLLPDPALRLTSLRTWLLLTPAVLALGVATAMLETEPTLVVAVAGWSVALAVLGILAATVRGGSAPVALGFTGYLVVLGLRLAVPSHLLVALLATVIAAGLTAAAWRTTGRLGRAVLEAAVVLTAGFAATQVVYLVGGRGDAAGIALALVAAIAGLLAAPITRSEVERTTVEATALLVGLVAVAFPVNDWAVTVVLSVVGSTVALVSVVERDRDQAAWLGAIILAVTAVLRVDAGLALPELATAPAAALLLVAGVRRLLIEPETGSIRALGSGLALALLPSLLIAIDEPVSVRAALLGCVAAVALGVGVTRRWAAPFLAGSATLAVLAIRHLGPIAEGLPRWISLGTVGVVLLAVAITWESRRSELATAERYLSALR